ncbi:hypothetical protein HPB48_014482 [Haemaphysalis longicornis]|uniref:Aldehyde dehydrogenase domain-containing protein n=1 Tax=Haemaphysalis longicornis TaxID=44386 RepID=A0A9J6GHI0_HAELO|nr:hypothetical protein HPB48_014482 [Haemaphysalis longicornis]
MGRKNAAIVFEDTAQKKCIGSVIKACFLNQGEVCICTTGIYIHKKLYQTFTEAFASGGKEAQGRPAPERVCAWVRLKQHLKHFRLCITLATEDGGKMLCGGIREEPDLPKENKNG